MLLQEYDTTAACVTVCARACDGGGKLAVKLLKHQYKYRINTINIKNSNGLKKKQQQHSTGGKEKCPSTFEARVCGYMRACGWILRSVECAELKNNTVTWHRRLEEGCDWLQQGRPDPR